MLEKYKLVKLLSPTGGPLFIEQKFILISLTTNNKDGGSSVNPLYIDGLSDTDLLPIAQMASISIFDLDNFLQLPKYIDLSPKVTLNLTLDLVYEGNLIYHINTDQSQPSYLPTFMQSTYHDLPTNLGNFRFTFSEGFYKAKILGSIITGYFSIPIIISQPWACYILTEK